MDGVANPSSKPLDGARKLLEGDTDSTVSRFVGTKFVVAAAQVLHERVPGGEDPR
jgi:hypothetical protein